MMVDTNSSTTNGLRAVSTRHNGASRADRKGQGFMLKFQKPADGTLGSLDGAGQGTERRRTVWIWTERVLLASGLTLLAVYGAARIESIVGSRAALEKFTALNSSTATVSRSDGEWIHSSQEFDHAGT
jgi:hypothetical protein